MRDALASAESLAGAFTATLGDAVHAVVLHGSLTLGGYVPGRSDIDLLVVAEEPFDDSRLAALTAAATIPPTQS